jgi:hypothetical protein
VAPRLRTASPAEVDGSLPPEGPVPSVSNRSGSYEGRRGIVGSHEEDGMVTIMGLAMAAGLMSGMAQAARWTIAVAVQRQAGVSRARGH